MKRGDIFLKSLRGKHWIAGVGNSGLLVILIQRVSLLGYRLPP